jgi:hypothetical protein
VINTLAGKRASGLLPPGVSDPGFASPGSRGYFKKVDGIIQFARQKNKNRKAPALYSAAYPEIIAKKFENSDHLFPYLFHIYFASFPNRL